MSTELDYLKFHQKVDDWVRIYEVGGQMERNDLNQKLRKALALLPYFQITKTQVGSANFPMVEIKGGFSITRRNGDMVKLDLLRVLNDHVARGEAVHTFITTPEGFNLAMACDQGRNVLGTFQITVTALR